MNVSFVPTVSMRTRAIMQIPQGFKINAVRGLAKEKKKV
jgi:hypothetical protein